MERKLSEKATKVRQRFLFSRSGQGRHRASTMNASAGATSTPNSRPRSATTPVSSNSTDTRWDNPGPSRYYDFTDEPGYFRPASPLLSRQEIEEDLEDDMKHACAMLIHSIERGLPMWPSSYTDIRPNTGTGSAAKASVTETAFQFLGQSYHVSSGSLGNETSASSEMYDSGVAFSNHSSAKMGKTGQSSFTGTGASAGTGRFYGRRLSTSPPGKETFDRGRARGQSFATDATSIISRSRSSSPILFPYSPPQPDARWIHEEDEEEEHGINNPTSPDGVLERNAILGAEGITWLRASLDVHRACDHESITTKNKPRTAQPKDQVNLSTVSVTGPQPRRFYSTRRLPSEKIFQPQEWAYEVASSRGSSLCDGTPARGLSFDEKRDIDIHDWANRNLHDHYSSKGLEKAGAMYSVAMPGPQPGHRRKRASELLRKLVGRRRKEGVGVERRFERAVVTAV